MRDNIILDEHDTCSDETSVKLVLAEDELFINNSSLQENDIILTEKTFFA
jgi:hypothetical protein